MTGSDLDHFRGVSADPASLWMVGRSHLPQLAEAVYEAGNQLNTQIPSEVFDRYTPFPDGSPSITSSAMAAAWEQLHDAFQSALYQSTANLYDSGDALVAVACSFAETDEGVADQIAGSIEAHLSGEDWDIPSGDRMLPPEADQEFVERPELYDLPPGREDEAFSAPDRYTDDDGNQVAL